jgi:alpha/beta superfamily hydrolase
MEFTNPQFDGPFEVSEIEIYNEGERIRGMLYFPPNEFKKPYPLIIYFHEFPQLFSFQEVVKQYIYLLEMGYAFLVFNFRGYRLSEGKISLKSQISDGLKIGEFAEKMAEKDIFKKNNLNILANDFGGYIALLVSNKSSLLNRVLLLSPIIDLEKHVYSNDFKKVLAYIKRFLPTNVRGIGQIEDFIEYTRKEMSNKELNLKSITQDLHFEDLKIIIGEKDKVTPLNEVKLFIKKLKKDINFSIIPEMDHEAFDEEDLKKIEEEIKEFFAL